MDWFRFNKVVIASTIIFLSGGISAQSLGIQSGVIHSLALDKNGKVYAWGGSLQGQVGNGTTSTIEFPTLVLKGEYPGTTYLGDDSDNQIIAIASGQYFSLALSEDGLVYAWGSNDKGSLGDGSTQNKTTPVKVLKGEYAGTTYLGDNASNKIIAISGGGEHALAVAEDGLVYSWGKNDYAQLGDNTDTDRSTPIKVLKEEYAGTTYLGDNPDNKIIAIAAGGLHSLALAEDGLVYAWGKNVSGQLGDNTDTGKAQPVKVLAGEYNGSDPLETYLGSDANNKITAIAAGENHSLALGSSGIAYAWGSKYYGQLGDNTQSYLYYQPTPVKVTGTTPSETVPKTTAIAAGEKFSISLNAEGAVYAWGRNNAGQLGIDSYTSYKEGPQRVLKGDYSGTTYLGDDSDNTIVGIAACYEYFFALAQDGTIYATGQNAYYNLGVDLEYYSDARTPKSVLGLDGESYLDIDDTDGPTVSSFSPTDDNTEVNNSSNLVITFDENVFKGTGNIVIYNSDGTAFETIDVTDSKVTVSNSTVTIDPEGTFSQSSTYYVNIDNTVFKDEIGNAFAGISDATTWNFTVLAEGIYQGEQISVSVEGVKTGTLTITDSGTITDLNVNIPSLDMYQTSAQYLSIILLSPYGTAVKLADSYASNTNFDGDLYLTTLDDEASTGFWEENPPYTGTYKPVESLSSFDGQSITGEWSLVVHLQYNYSGTIDWQLIVETDNSTAYDKPNWGTEYTASQISVSVEGVKTGTLTITDSGTITDLNVNIPSLDMYQTSAQYLSITILSPDGTAVKLADSYASNTNFDGDLYMTTLDDEVSTGFWEENPPYTGTYKPVESLSSFDGQSITGEWSLVVNLQYNYSGTIDWSLLINSPLSRPTVTISSTESSPTSTTPIPITVTFSESVTKFESSDVVINNATLSNFSGSGTTYTFDLTPPLAGDITVDIGENVARSPFGYGNEAASTFTITYEPPAPIITISSSHGSATNQLPIPISITFSDDVTGFESSDITLSNGSINNFSGSGTSYSFEIVSPSEGPITVDIVADVAQNVSGTGNKAATQYSITYDISSPSVSLSWTVSSPTNVTSIPITITFNENISGFEANDLRLVNCTVTNLSGGGKDYSLDLSPSSDGNIEIQLPSESAQDAAGNKNTESNQLSALFDGNPPTLGVVNDGSGDDIDFQTTNTTVSANWSGFSDEGTGIDYYEWAIGTTAGGTDSQDWVNVGISTSETNSSLSLSDGSYYTSVRAADVSGNVSSAASSDGFIIDTTPPTAPNNLSATAGDMIITLSWDTNPESDVVKYFLYRSETSGFNPSGANRIAEIDSANTSYIDSGIEYNINYYYKLSALDHGEHESNFSSEVSATPQDLTAPTVQILEPKASSRFELGTEFNISWEAQDNGSVVFLDIDYSVDGGLNWAEVAQEEINDGLFPWLVPNNPSEDVSLRLIARDPAELSDTSEVSGLAIYIVYPEVAEVEPLSGTINWYQNEIKLHFSRPMDPDVFTSNNVQINSNHSSPPSLNYNEPSNILSIKNSSSFASYDTIDITLDASGIKSSYGYALDGDGDGSPGDDFKINYTTALHADYDTSDTIDDIDLATLLQGLETKDLTYEIGPVVGTAPHFSTVLDSLYDIEDIMAFVMMWNWYSTANNILFREFTSSGLPINIQSSPDTIELDLPENILAYQVQVKYPLGSLIIHNSSKEEDITLVKNDESRGVFTMLVKKGNEQSLSLPVTAQGRGADIRISFRAIGRDGEIVSQITNSFHVEGIPESYALHQNYPNPFNPVTKIEYDIPGDGNVSLIIYDIMGRQVKTLVSRFQSAGYHEITWNGINEKHEQVGTGMYFYQLESAGFVKTKKMVLLK